MSPPSSVTRSPSTLFSVIRCAQPAVVLGDIVAIATRIVDCSAGPGRIVLRRVVLRLQCRQLELAQQGHHLRVFLRKRICGATLQALGQFAQRAHIRLGQRAIGELLAQLLQPLAGDLRLLAQRLTLQRRKRAIGPLALAAEEAATASVQIRTAAGGAEVAGAAIGPADTTTLVARLRSTLATLALLTLALLSALPAVLAGLAIARLGRLRARRTAIAAIRGLRPRLCLRTLQCATQVAKLGQQVAGIGFARRIAPLSGFGRGNSGGLLQSLLQLIQRFIDQAFARSGLHTAPAFDLHGAARQSGPGFGGFQVALCFAHLCAGAGRALAGLLAGAAHLALQVLQARLDLALGLRQPFGLLVAQAAALLCTRPRDARRRLRCQRAAQFLFGLALLLAK